jgi:hypothetical protein
MRIQATEGSAMMTESSASRSLIRGVTRDPALNKSLPF